MAAEMGRALSESSCACDTVSIGLSGAALTSQGSRDGEYVRVNGVTQGGRAVYQKSGGSDYLYFFESYSNWRVGPDYTVSNGGLYETYLAQYRAQCPEDTGTWWNTIIPGTNIIDIEHRGRG